MDARAEERDVFPFRMAEVYNFNTGKIEPSDYWLKQEAEKIHELRYGLRAGKKRYGCPICKTQVSLRKSTKQNWFFGHHQRKEGVHCALIDEHMPLIERKIQKYNAAKETEEHKRMKYFIGDYLRKDPNVLGTPDIEKIVKGTYTPHKWKRPDVICQRGSWKIVFEVQISNTWLSDIVERDLFYANNHTVIIWVFNSFDSCEPDHDTTKADIFYNNPEVNLFVLDEEAMEVSKTTHTLTLNAHFRVPEINYQTQTISNRWNKQLVTLNDLTFDQQTFKPYVVSYFDKKKEAISKLEGWKQKEKLKAREEYELKIKEEIEAQNERQVVERRFIENEARRKVEERALAENERNRKEEEKRRIENEASAIEARKIENRCPKEFSKMSAKECVDLIFGEECYGRNINSLNNKIKELESLGFILPEDIIDEIELRGWIEKKSSNGAIAYYERTTLSRK